MRTEVLYTGFTIIIITLIFLLARCRFDKLASRSNFSNPISSKLLADTETGTQQVDSADAATELERIKLALMKNKAGATVKSKDLSKLIDQSIHNLTELIQRDPQSNNLEDALCKLEFKADVIDQQLADSISPYESEWSTAYKTTLEWEKHEKDMNHDPTKRLEYLIQHLDIAIKLLRNEVCDNGRINLKQLKDILHELNKQIRETGEIPIQYGYNPHKRYDRPPPLPLFIKDSVLLEPFAADEAPARGMPGKRSFGSFEVNPRDVNSQDTRAYLQREHRARDDSMEDADSQYADPAKPFKIRNTIEGSVEQDILGYKPPGHIMSQLYDKTDHYTVVVNSCLGETPSDDSLYENCTSHDMRLLNALDGNPKQMLDCIGECNSKPNYLRFYNRFPDSIQKTDMIQDLDNYV